MISASSSDWGRSSDSDSSSYIACVVVDDRFPVPVQGGPVDFWEKVWRCLPGESPCTVDSWLVSFFSPDKPVPFDFAPASSEGPFYSVDTFVPEGEFSLSLLEQSQVWLKAMSSKALSEFRRRLPYEEIVRDGL